MSELKTLDNVFPEISSFPWLETAYRNARKQKRYRDEVLTFSNDLDANLLEIQEELENGTFRFGPYRRHWVYVPKKRLVMALPFKSRIVQWAIYQKLNPFYDRLMIEDSYACRIGKCPKIKKRRRKNGKLTAPTEKRKGILQTGTRMSKGTLAAALRVQYWMQEAEGKKEQWYALKLDISKFFYRVDHAVLLDILEQRIKDPKLLALLDNVINCDGERFGLPRFTSPEDIGPEEWLPDIGMPIGNLTSQLFANIYLNELDQFAKHTLHIHRYARYMDDIVIIAPDKETAHRWKKAIAQFLQERLHLDLNSKTSIRPVERIEFVGYIVTARELRLRKQTVRRIKSAFHGICRKLFTGEITREEFDRRVASYDGLIAPCEADNLRTRLNQIYLREKEKAA